MRDFRWRRSWWELGFRLSTAACLASGSALAQVQVTQMMYVQPIDVCQDDGTHCAPFNTLSPTGNPSNQDQTTNPIGFVDPATGKDITRALLNQIGVDVTWLPIAPLKSSSFQTLNVLQGSTTCGLGTTVTGFQSCDLLTLTQQPQISQNPTPVYIPTSPLAPQPNVFNLFFVNKINPPVQQPGTQLYDLTWVGNNGGALAGNVFFSSFPLTPRTDVLAHGLMHGLGADHPILGAGPYNPFSATTNPLGGVVPPIPPNPVIGECDAAYPACKANLMTRGDLRTQPSPNCILAQPPLPSACLVKGVPKPTFSNGMADQLTTLMMENPALPESQETYVQMSGFLTPIANTPTAVCRTTPCPPAAAAAAVTSGAIKSSNASLSTASSISTSSSSIIFNLSGPTDGLPGDTLTAWILISNGFTFASNNRFHIINQSRENLLQDVDVPHPDPDVPFHPCDALQCLEVEFNRNPGQGFGPTDFIEFSQGIVVEGSPITLDELCGAKVVYIFKSGGIITSTLGSCSGSSLTANSQMPDATTPNQVVDPHTLVVTSDVPPCTVDPTTHVCRDPRTTGVEDGNPKEQPQLCYFHGSPVQCP